MALNQSGLEKIRFDWGKTEEREGWRDGDRGVEEGRRVEEMEGERSGRIEMTPK